MLLDVAVDSTPNPTTRHASAGSPAAMQLAAGFWIELGLPSIEETIHGTQP
jgi:hypothetical protein